MARSDCPNSAPIAVRHITTRKKSKASSVQPRKLAITAAQWSLAGAAGGDASVCCITLCWSPRAPGAQVRRSVGTASESSAYPALTTL